MADIHSVYWLDADDRVEWVDDRWRAFANENDAPNLPGRVVGTSLWPYIAGNEIAQIYRALFARVREGRTLHVPYRCDAPRRIREFELELAPRGAAGIACTTRVIAERDRTPMWLIDAHAPRGNELLAMCSWCKRVHLDEWVEPEDAVRRLGLFAGGSVPRITHGACPVCVELLLAESA